MPIGPAKMPLMAHLGELRKRLAVVVVCLGVAAIGLYFVTDPIFAFLIKPVASVLEGGKPIAIAVLDPMGMRFSLALWSAVVLTSPIIIWQVLAFLLPAMRPKERKWILPTFVAMVVLFVIGVVFCYTIVIGPSFTWLADQAGSIMRFMPQASDMVTVVEFFLLGFGVAFQTPVVVFYLVYFGVVPYATLRKNWRIVYVSTFVIAAGITPDWSPVSMLALGFSMIILYEMSLALVRVVLARRIKARDAALAEDG
jgi:sec-independent protein translocase protein TatC